MFELHTLDSIRKCSQHCLLLCLFSSTLVNLCPCKSPSLRCFISQSLNVVNHLLSLCSRFRLSHLCIIRRVTSVFLNNIVFTFTSFSGLDVWYSTFLYSELISYSFHITFSRHKFRKCQPSDSLLLATICL